MASRAPSDTQQNDGEHSRLKGRVAKLLSGFANPAAHRYTIEVRDARSGEVVMFAAVDWTKTQKRTGLAKIRMASGLPHDKHST